MAEKSPTVITLATIERVVLQQVVAEIEGNSRMMRKALRVLDILEFTPDERKEINLRQTANGGLQWDKPDREWELTFPDGNDYAFLKGTFKAHVWKGVHPKLVVAIEDRLGIKAPEEEEA